MATYHWLSTSRVFQILLKSVRVVSLAFPPILIRYSG
ncbi:unnamed protein product [Rodentolepis nana]|uniref:Uncharacterized protein n=1 Tax=Rodentolepis nana TaxID=102285 RepID=A0A0R3T168_RODNA|nr:unnamed protein product [Rodentolepis nana]